MLAATAVASSFVVTPAAAQAAPRPVLDVRHFGADPTGKHESGAAIRRALAAAADRGAELRFVAGTYRVRATGAATFLELAEGVEVSGPPTGPRPTLRLESDDQAAYRELFRITGSNVSIDRMRLVRSGTFPAVLLNAACGSALSITRTLVDGRLLANGGPNWAHGVQLGLGNSTQTGIRIDRSEFRDLTSCVLITNGCQAVLRKIAVTRSKMQSVDFNCPNADVSGVEVSGNRIDGTGSTSFGVSFAHVRDAVVRDNVIRDVLSEAIHIEDHSSRIVIERNHFRDCASRGVDASAYVQIISGSNQIVVRGNQFAGRIGHPARSTFFVAAMPGGSGLTVGGRPMSAPSAVRVHDNTFDVGKDEGIDGIYLQSVRTARIESNWMRGPMGGGRAAATTRSAIIVRGEGGSDLRLTKNKIGGWRFALDALGPATGTFSSNKVSKGTTVRRPGRESIRTGSGQNML